MNESRRAVAHVPGVRMYCAGMWCCAWGKRLFLCPACVCFVAGGAAEVSRGRSAAFPRLTTSRSGAPGRTVGEVEDLRKDACVQRVCDVTRASLVRARAARALSEAAESRRAVAHVPGVRMYCTGMWCCAWGKRLFLCPACVCFVAGALRRSHAESRQPPNPKGWTSRSCLTGHLFRPPGRPCRKSPGLFVLSLSHSLECS